MIRAIKLNILYHRLRWLLKGVGADARGWQIKYAKQEMPSPAGEHKKANCYHSN